MDLLNIFSCKNINDSSKQLYVKNILKLNDNKTIKNLNFLKNHENIDKKLEKYKPNTQRSYIISIVSLLKCLNDNKFKKTLDYYYNKMMEYNKVLKTQNEMTENEKENWISQEEIHDKYNEIKKDVENINSRNISIDQYNKLLDYMLLSLYVLNPPRRNKDYQIMKVIKSYNKDLPNENNYLDMSNRKFIFNNYKTNKTYQQQIIDINDELKNVIILYLKYHPLKKEMKNKNFMIDFLVYYNGSNFKNVNDITRRLNKIFGKNIGVSMIRKIYLTDKYKGSNDEMKKDATAMGTSSNVIENNYIKDQ